MVASRRVAAALIVWSALGMIGAVVPDTPVLVRAILGVPLVLVLPGLAWMGLLGSKRLDLAARLVASVMASVILVIVTGLALNWSPWGLTAPAWTLILGLLTAIPSLVQLRGRDPRTTAVRVPVRAAVLIAPIAVAGCVLVLAYELAVSSALTRHDDGFTQLWLVSDANDCSGDLRIGLASYELEPVTLHLELLVDQEPLTEWSWPSIEPGQRWETTRQIVHPGARVVEARLSRDGQPDDPYRWVRVDCASNVANAGSPGA